MYDLETILNSPELHFEVSESAEPLKKVIEEVEKRYPDFRFNRTEARYQSCIVAIFEKH